MTMRPNLFQEVDAAGVRVFGEQVTIKYRDLLQLTLDGVFEAPGERAVVVDGLLIASTKPSIGFHIADLTRMPEEGDTVVRAGVTYDVGEVTPDGQGGVTVELIRPRTS